MAGNQDRAADDDGRTRQRMDRLPERIAAVQAANEASTRERPDREQRRQERARQGAGR